MIKHCIDFKGLLDDRNEKEKERKENKKKTEKKTF